MGSFLKAAGGVSTMWGLAAFAIAAILAYLTKGSTRAKVTAFGWIGVFAITLLGLVPISGSLYLKSINTVYRLRVTVRDPRGIPVDNARVWSSTGGEPKKVSGGWEFDIPKDSVPSDGNATVYSEVADNHWDGFTSLQLGIDYSPNVNIDLHHKTSAKVRGIVVDADGRAIGGAAVSVIGYGAEGVLTKSGGGFELIAHAADGEHIQLHAEKSGYPALNQVQQAGDKPATLVLRKD